MTIDEAIKHCLEVAEQNDTQANKIGRQFMGSAMDKRATDCRECAADHRQLAEWLKELKDLREENKVLMQECDRLIKEKGELLKKSEQTAEYKRLLKAAVEALNDGSCNKDCRQCENHKSCDYGNRFKWKYTDEALALIGEDGENNA